MSSISVGQIKDVTLNFCQNAGREAHTASCAGNEHMMLKLLCGSGHLLSPRSGGASAFGKEGPSWSSAFPGRIAGLPDYARILGSQDLLPQISMIDPAVLALEPRNLGPTWRLMTATTMSDLKQTK